jgi:excisionase family DNA binding protein
MAAAISASDRLAGSEGGAPLPGMEPIVYSPKQAAEVLNVSVDTVRRMVGRCELPHVRVGAQIRIPVRGLHQWLSDNTISIR